MPEVKAFRTALKALGDWQRDVMGASQGGACAQCLYEGMLPAPCPTILRAIAHTCGKVAPVVTTKGRRRAKVAA